MKKLEVKAISNGSYKLSAMNEDELTVRTTLYYEKDPDVYRENVRKIAETFRKEGCLIYEADIMECIIHELSKRIPMC